MSELESTNLLGAAPLPTTSTVQETTSPGPAEAAGVPSALSPELSASFISSLPEELRKETSLSKFKDTASLARSYIHAEKMLGSSIRIPDANSSIEDIQSFYTKMESVKGFVRFDPKDPSTVDKVLSQLGRPETPDNYKLPDSVNALGKDLVNDFKVNAHKLGLTQTQAEALSAWQLSKEAELTKTLNSMTVKGQEALKKEWGLEYDAKIKGAQSLFETLAKQHPDEALLLKSQAGSNPLLTKILSELSKNYQEKSSFMSAGSSVINSQSEARAKIEAIKANRSHPFWNPSDGKAHREAVKEFHDLQRTAYGISDNTQ